MFIGANESNFGTKTRLITKNLWKNDIGFKEYINEILFSPDLKLNDSDVFIISFTGNWKKSIIIQVINVKMNRRISFCFRK